MDLKIILGIISGAAVLISACINVLVSYLNTKKTIAKTRETTLEVSKENIISLEKRRYLDSVSAERIKWVNNIRECFANFNKAVIFYAREIEHQQINLNKFEEISYYANLSELYLNPNEEISKEIVALQNNSIQIFTKVFDNGNTRDFFIMEVEENIERLREKQQLVLKAEWRRIKEEIITGEEMNKERIQEIYTELKV